MKLWSGRFEKDTDTLVDDFNSSIDFDARLYREDIEGSMAHAKMLGEQGIIEPSEADAIRPARGCFGRDRVRKASFSRENEDIHMNIETLLTKKSEPPANACIRAQPE